MWSMLYGLILNMNLELTKENCAYGCEVVEKVEKREKVKKAEESRITFGRMKTACKSMLHYNISNC